MRETTVSVLGCGWLGEPLARSLAHEGCVVKGSTRSSAKRVELEGAGIDASQFDLTPHGIVGNPDNFFECDVLFLNFPPERRPDIEKIYPAQVRHALAAISGETRVVFAGSTSIYPNTNGVVNEDCVTAPDKPSGMAMLAAETEVRKAVEVCVVLRYGGLIGAERTPGTFLKGKQGISGGNCPVNLIHRDDAVALARQAIEFPATSVVLNAVADAHPLRRDYYVDAANALGLSPPTFAPDSEAAWKIVDNTRIKEIFGYTFIYPDPSQCLTG